MSRPKKAQPKKPSSSPPEPVRFQPLPDDEVEAIAEALEGGIL